MELFYDKENNVLIKSTSTKGSKYLKKHYEELNLYKIMDNFTVSFNSITFDFSVFGVERIISASAYCKEKEIELNK
jgi:hypothetical protein